MFDVNSIRIEGSNNIVIQNADGSTVNQPIDELLKKLSQEKDRSISILEAQLADKEKIISYTEIELNNLRIQLETAHAEKLNVTSQFETLLLRFNKTDFSEQGTIFKGAMNLFLSGDLSGALAVLDESEIDESIRKFEVIEETLTAQKIQVYNALMFKFYLFGVQGQYSDAVKSAEKALRLHSELSDLLDLAGLLIFIGKINEAEDYLDRALSKAVDNQQKAQVLFGKAYLATSLHRYPEAFDMTSEAIELANPMNIGLPEKDKVLLAKLHEHRGTLCKLREEIFEAEKNFGFAIYIHRKLVDADGEKHLPTLAKSLKNAGSFYLTLNNYPAARTAFEESLRIYDTLCTLDRHFLPMLVRVLNELGVLYRNLNQFTQAKNIFYNAIEICNNNNINKFDLERLKGDLLNNLGGLLNHQGKYEEAELVLKDCISIRRDYAKIHPEVWGPFIADTLTNFGQLYMATRRYSLAIESLNECLTIYNKVSIQSPSETRSKIAQTQYNLAVIYMEIGNHDFALNNINLCISARRKLLLTNNKKFTPLLANGLGVYAAVLEQIEKLDLAEKAYQEAIELQRKVILPTHFKELGNYAMLCINLAGFYQSKIVNREKSISLILEAIQTSAMIPERSKNLLDSQRLAVQIIQTWGLDWEAFFQTATS